MRSPLGPYLRFTPLSVCPSPRPRAYSAFALPFSAPGIDLENIVYYKDDTHYFVMTAKKKSLLKKGVIKEVRTRTHTHTQRKCVIFIFYFFWLLLQLCSESREKISWRLSALVPLTETIVSRLTAACFCLCPPPKKKLLTFKM